MNILRNKVTRNALLFTFLMLIIYRLGSFIITPGVDTASLAEASAYYAGNVDAIFNFFGGGSISTMTLFALGVAPMVTASIVIQICEKELVPSMQEWKNQGIDGQRLRSKRTKQLAIILAFCEALTIGVMFYLSSGTLIADYNSMILVMLLLTAGTCTLIYISDRITEHGIGNGVSILISAGILASIPMQLNTIYAGIKSAGEITNVDIMSFILIGILALVLVMIIIIYNLSYRNVPINYVQSKNKVQHDSSYLPIKLNPAGVIPIIFVAPLMLIMDSIVSWLTSNLEIFLNDGAVGQYEMIFRSFFGGGDYWILYVLTYGTLIFLFSIFYSHLQMNPEQMGENLEKQGAYVPGFKPGQETVDYLNTAIIQTSFWGAILLAFIAVVPIILFNVLDYNINFILLGTGLIIVISVIIQSYELLSNKTQSKKYRKFRL